MVYPLIHATKMVISSTTGITSTTTMAGRNAMNASNTSTKTKPVATKSLKMSSLTLSLAVSP